MQLLLNTIMLEVNRWTADHQLTRPLVDLLEPVKKAGFGDCGLLSATSTCRTAVSPTGPPPS